MLSFDAKGLLIPDTIIVSSVSELKRHFVEDIPSVTRNGNFEKYIGYSEALKQLLSGRPLKQWINGSFVTKVSNPNDIDIVTFIDSGVVTELKEQLDNFGAKGAMDNYGVDGYILEVFPEGHPQYFFYKSDMAYWMEQFGKTRRGLDGQKSRKGFLEIIY
jgi:uncharacterized protein DUF6932